MSEIAPECCGKPMVLTAHGNGVAWICGTCELVVHPGSEHLIGVKRKMHCELKSRDRRKGGAVC